MGISTKITFEMLHGSLNTNCTRHVHTAIPIMCMYWILLQMLEVNYNYFSRVATLWGMVSTLLWDRFLAHKFDIFI